MKINWKIDIENKKISLNESDFSFDFEIVFDFNNWSVVPKAIAYKNEAEKELVSNAIDSFKSEFRVLHLLEKLGKTKVADGNKIKMYKLEDNIYVSKDGQICTFHSDSFYDTPFFTSVYPIDENTNINLVKMSIYCEDDIIKFKDFEIDDSINKINTTPFIYKIKDDYEFIKVNKSHIFIYDEFAKKDIQTSEDKELIEALVNVLIYGNKNFLTWNKFKERLKY